MQFGPVFSSCSGRVQPHISQKTFRGIWVEAIYSPSYNRTAFNTNSPRMHWHLKVGQSKFVVIKIVISVSTEERGTLSPNFGQRTTMPISRTFWESYKCLVCRNRYIAHFLIYMYLHYLHKNALKLSSVLAK